MTVTRCVVLFLTLVLVVVDVHAGIVGKISGRVVDAQQAPVAGVSIIVVGTTGHAITDEHGKFAISGIVAGKVSLRIVSEGFDSVLMKLTLHADESRAIDFTLSSSANQTSHVLELEDDRVRFSTSVIGTDRNIDEKVLQGIATPTVSNGLDLLPSLTLYGVGYSARSSPPTSTQVRVDGLIINDPINGGVGSGSPTLSASMPSPYALRSVNIKSGGYGVEYGGVNSAIVNTIVQTGHADRISALVNWRTDVPLLFGNGGNGIQAGAAKEDVVDVAVGGPLGFNNSTFFLSIRNTFQNHRDYGLQVLDPLGNNLGEMPNNRTWARNIIGRVRLEVAPDVSLLIGGMFGMVNDERSTWTWLYANDEVNGVAERIAKQLVVQDVASNAFIQLQHMLNSVTSYNLRVSFNRTSTEAGKRKSFGAPNMINGFELYMPEDVAQLQRDTAGQIVGTFVPGSNAILDVYETNNSTAFTEDGYLKIERPVRNPLTGFVEGEADGSSTSNPYGLLGYFAARGNEGGVDFHNAEIMQVDGCFAHTIDAGSVQQTFQAGFEARAYRLSNHSNANPWSATPLYDVYGPDYGGNPYVLDSALVTTRMASEDPYRPLTASMYVQDQITYDGLVITPGVRMDYLDAAAMYRVSEQPFTPFGSSTGFSQTTAKIHVSPRLAITYPLSASGRQSLSVAGGLYYQTPPFAEFYMSNNAIHNDASQRFGDPNLDLLQSNQYQVMYNQQLNDDYAFNITGYYNESNYTVLRYVPILPNPYYKRTAAHYVISRGIEVAFKKRVSDNWGVDFNYALSSTTATSYDRTHRMNGLVMLRWGNDEGPTIGGMPFLEHVAITLSGYWQTGLQFSYNATSGPDPGFHTDRLPSNWNTDIRLLRTFALDDLLGVATELDVYFDATNLFNITGAIRVYQGTGSSDYDGAGLNRTMGDFPSTTYYKEVDLANKETVSRSQYDLVGKRRYNPVVDANADGKVTPEESFKAYQSFVETVVERRINYQYPRQVYVGMTFRF